MVWGWSQSQGTQPAGVSCQCFLPGPTITFPAASPPFGRYQITLLDPFGDRGTCVNNLPKVVTSTGNQTGVEHVTSWSHAWCPNHWATQQECTSRINIIIIRSEFLTEITLTTFCLDIVICCACSIAPYVPCNSLTVDKSSTCPLDNLQTQVWPFHTTMQIILPSAIFPSVVQ